MKKDIEEAIEFYRITGIPHLDTLLTLAKRCLELDGLRGNARIDEVQRFLGVEE
jgi:hypothetical protein